MPGPWKKMEEVKIHRFKDDVMKVARKMKGKCKEWANLNEEERVGLESLRRWMRMGDVVCCVTDNLRDLEKTPEIGA